MGFIFLKPKLRKSFDIVTLEDKGILFKSDISTLKFEGKDIQQFIQKVVPLLNGNNTYEQIFRSLSDYKRDDIIRCIDLLSQNNLLQEGNVGDDVFNEVCLNRSPQLELFKDLGLAANVVIERLKNSRVIVLGLGAHGAYLVSALANEGIGNIKCFDPSLLSNEDLYLSSIYQSKDLGNRREDALFERLGDSFPSTRFEKSNIQNVSEQDIEKCISDRHFAICCMDKGFSSVHYWLNKAALKKEMPWCTASLEGVEGILGPMVLPGETACFMCYKMRAAANERSFAETMAYYQYLDKNKKDELYRRANTSINAGIIGNYLALEVLKAILGFTQSPLIGRICVINFLTLNTEFHTVLRKPDCPHCGFKKKSNLLLSKEGVEINDLSKLESILVSPRVGIIKSINRVLKDGPEPDVPYVLGTSLSNFNYYDNAKDDISMASGKGMTLQEAKISALGEAIERYSSSQYNEKKIKIAKYQELRDAINPSDLVLYSDAQYDSGILPYSKFSEHVEMGWVEGKSLVTAKNYFLPALAVFLYYNPINHQEFLFAPTSNGLAAGSSLLQAQLNGLLEVIERDAFLITWLCKLPMPRLNLSSVQSKRIQDILRMYERRGVYIHVNVLILDTIIPTFMAIATDTTDKGPAVVVGLSSHPNSEAAIYKAILEISQLRPHLRTEMRKPGYRNNLAKLMQFENVKTIHDHELLYTSNDMLHAFDFLLHNENSIGISELPQVSGGVDEQLKYCIRNVAKIGVDAISVDVTTPDIATFGLSVARVIVPGFQPMHFGYNECRLGGDRLFTISEKLGFTDHRLTIKELNTFPHPLG